MGRLRNKFEELKEKNRPAFIAYITAGDPSLAISKKLIFELGRSVDIIELGVPFSDPLADGPVIQKASLRALESGTTLLKIINLVKSIRSKVNIPLCLMSYYNPIYRLGLSRFARYAKRAGIDGVIVPDLPPEEAREFTGYMKKARLDTIFFVSPTSSIRRIKLAASKSSGFIYYVTLTGVTGARNKLAQDLKKRIALIKKYTKKPVCVGFGISRPEQVRELSAFCDGIIVGSAIVDRVSKNIGNKNLVKIVSTFVCRLRRAIE